MSEGLKKLKEIEKCMVQNCDYADYYKDFETIEKELKEYKQYKIIEEELGIDLMTLLKASKEGFWYNSNGTFYFDHFDISLVNRCFRKYIDYLRDYISFDFKDYGKTWSLTKEELL